MASPPLRRGKETLFVCLPCTNGFPNPFLFDYKCCKGDTQKDVRGFGITNVHYAAIYTNRKSSALFPFGA